MTSGTRTTMIHFRPPRIGEETELAELRARAMRPSLELLGRYDAARVRQRLLEGYNSGEITVIDLAGTRIGFLCVIHKGDHCYLKHLYIDEPYQGQGYGTRAISFVLDTWPDKEIRLNALKGSPANKFYVDMGFVFLKEEEYDNYYVYRPKVN